ncbi:hypothetical protein [Wolbachia sp. wLmal]|uniref:hypothetical protein n=1 Tax=Wolbachia sp. wLmal TaxID=3342489 RepID=UPI003C2CC7DF
MPAEYSYDSRKNHSGIGRSSHESSGRPIHPKETCSQRPWFRTLEMVALLNY